MNRLVLLFSAIIVIIGLLVGLYLIQQPQPQKTTSQAAILSPPATPGNKADFDGNGVINNLDYTFFLQKYEEKDNTADLDASGAVNSLDYNLFLSLME